MLEFPYMPEPFRGRSAGSSAQATVRWRPLIPVRVFGPTGKSRLFPQAVLDTGADDTIIPLDTAQWIGAGLRPSGSYAMRWRGQVYPLQFADVELKLTGNGETWRWPTVVAFSPAPLRHPLLGYSGCLQFLDAKFLGSDRLIQLDPNRSYPGTT